MGVETACGISLKATYVRGFEVRAAVLILMKGGWAQEVGLLQLHKTAVPSLFALCKVSFFKSGQQLRSLDRT